ncbi:hypothetical protein BST61_g2613 [Cercospora zeina]
MGKMAAMMRRQRACMQRDTRSTTISPARRTTRRTQISFVTLVRAASSFLISFCSDASGHHSPSTFNAAAVELDEDTHHVVKDRAVLVLFWCTLPLVLGVATISELFRLWTDRLAPVWVLISSSIAVCVWAAQMALWQLCVGSVRSRPTPDFCPNTYQTSSPGITQARLHLPQQCPQFSSSASSRSPSQPSWYISNVDMHFGSQT